MLGAEQMSGKKDFLGSDEVSRLPTLICEFEECGNKVIFCVGILKYIFILKPFFGTGSDTKNEILGKSI